jgi:hypothetical protein
MHLIKVLFCIRRVPHGMHVLRVSANATACSSAESFPGAVKMLICHYSNNAGPQTEAIPIST